MSYSLPKSRPPPVTPTPVTEYKHCKAASDGGNATRICLSAHLCGETPTFQPPSQTAQLLPCARLITWRGHRPAPYGPSRCNRPRSLSAALVAPGKPSSLREAGIEPGGPTPGQWLLSLTGILHDPSQRNNHTTARVQPWLPPRPPRPFPSCFRSELSRFPSILSPHLWLTS